MQELSFPVPTQKIGALLESLEASLGTEEQWLGEEVVLEWWILSPNGRELCNMNREIEHKNSEEEALEGICYSLQFSHSLVSDSLSPWTAAHHASLSITKSLSPPKPMSIESVMPSNHLILCVPFSFCPQSFPASGSFQMSQFFASGGPSIEVSASTSVLPMNTQDWSPLGWTGWISLQFKGLSRVFSKTTVQKHQFFCAQLSL